MEFSRVMHGHIRGRLKKGIYRTTNLKHVNYNNVETVWKAMMYYIPYGKPHDITVLRMLWDRVYETDLYRFNGGTYCLILEIIHEIREKLMNEIADEWYQAQCVWDKLRCEKGA